MSFYDLNVTKPIIKSNGVTNLGPSGQPVYSRLVLGGVLEKIALITQGTPTFTGTVSRDINGGYNLFSNISVIPNQQVPIYSCCGFGSHLFTELKAALENDLLGIFDWKEGTVAAVPDLPDSTYVNSSAITAAPSGAQSTLWTVPHIIPIVQQMFNGVVGYWELGNPLAQLTVQLTPAYTGQSSPFGIASLTAGALPYTGTAIPATNNATLASPTTDVVRYLWDTPVNPDDRPPVTFINTVIEDTFQNAVGSASSLKYTFAPLSGYIARVIAYVVNSTTSLGVDPTLCLNSNTFQFGIGDGTVLISESIYETLLRQRQQVNGDLRKGEWFLDFLGPDLTWQSVFSTYDNANVNLALNFSSALGASSYGKIVRQVLKPLQYTAR